MTWVLKPTAHSLFARFFDTKVKPYRRPNQCPHIHTRWCGDNWDCVDCGEPVRDREEKTQENFTFTLYTEPREL